MTMKSVFLSMAVAAVLLTTSARAETINCTEIKPVPFVITAPGVYCLKRNFNTALPSGNLIEIQTSNVTIDLNSFRLDGGLAGAGTTAVGIWALDRNNITVRNGTIRGFYRGVKLEGGTSSGNLLEDLLLHGNRSVGAEVWGSGHVIRNNRVFRTKPGGIGTFAYGIWVQNASNTLVADNVVSDTAESSLASGIYVSDSTLIEVRGNTVLDTRTATDKRGIYAENSADVTVIDNRVLNAAANPGTIGVGAGGAASGINCIDNTVFGFTTALSGCNFEAGTNPPQP